ncbi:MAG: tetratricopeptide repeat protein [Saprospirales bacterium]|nr:tetratricopeptide repeat protein [Saprospirales bacterium]
MNTILKSGLTEEVLSRTEASQLYKAYPAYLQRAADLLGKEYYLYPSLLARKYFFEGKTQLTNAAKQQAYFKALELQPYSPHVMVELIDTYEAAQEDSATYYGLKAAELAPTWVVPYIRLAFFYEKKAKDLDKAEAMLNQAGLIDTSSVYVWYAKANLFHSQKKYLEAEQLFEKVIKSSGSEICFPCANQNLGVVYQETGRVKKAIGQYQKAIQLDPHFAMAYYNLACVNSLENRTGKAFKYLEDALKIDFDEYLWMQEDMDLIHLRAHRKRWDALIRKYFPDKVNK